MLVELMQGPCAENQELLSSSGMVETALKVIAGRFETLQGANDTGGLGPLAIHPYPKQVRRVKAACADMLNSMLESRRDANIHKNLVYRMNLFVVKQRIIFGHRYFVCSVLELGPFDPPDFDGRGERLRGEHRPQRGWSELGQIAGACRTPARAGAELSSRPARGL